MNQPNPQAVTRTRRALLLLGLILLAFALRVYRLDAQSLWYDEGVTADVAQRNIGALTQWTANDIQPPLYYYIVAGWGRVAGWSEWSLRFPSVFCGVLLVPLLAVLALRLTRRSSPAVLLAALFAALHPLLLYYSQEARMYTLLTALGVLIGYSGWQLLEDSRQRVWLLSYILAGTAAVYTHYFAFFLLLAVALAWFVVHWRDRHLGLAPQPRAFVANSAFLVANGVIFVLYLPWFAFLLTRLAVDASYWQGEFKLWEALRSVAVSFTSGQTVQEQIAVWLLIPAGLLTLWAGFALGLSASSPAQRVVQRRLLIYLLLWLGMPVAAVLLLASFAPKFNARYVMIALPGLLLLWAIGLAQGIEGRDWRSEIRDSRQKTHGWPLATGHWSLVSGLCLLCLLLTFLYADRNWFVDPAFTKDEWREVAAFLQARMRPEETVILVSGHVWPVWHYYAPTIPAVRLPDIDVLNVNAVLTFANTAGPLRAAFAKETGKTGAWIIDWQDDVVDPTGIVPVQLELAGREKGQPTPFWKLKVRRFANIKPNHIAAAPPIATAVQANFGNQVLLQGYTVLDNGDLLLFWEHPATAPALTGDIQITGQVWTALGEQVAQLADQRPAGYGYPVARWPTGESVMGKIPAVGWLGHHVQDGTYRLRLRVYTVATGQVQPLPLPDGQDFIELTPLVKLD